VTARWDTTGRVTSCTQSYGGVHGVADGERARVRLPEILDRVEAGEEITITRHGRPAAVLLRPDNVRVRRGESTIDQARAIGRMLEEARHRPLGEPTMTVERAEEFVAEIRADRDGR
jgi:antitoxin (DNA-binding transcriptional repressor) of toxin-antitoxin stability system